MRAAMAMAPRRVIGYYLSPTVGTVEVEAPPQRGLAIPAPSVEMPAGDVAEEIRAEFESAVRRLGIEGSWILGGESSDLAEVIAGSRCADLVIAGLAPVPGYGSDPQGIDVEALVIESGRPILGLPLANIWTRIGSNVVVAWDGSREAARAVHDALPFLHDARTVRIISIETDPNAPCSPVSLASHLRRIGISAEIDANTRMILDTPEGEILARLQEGEADLLVAGAFGHPRLTERLFGGASRTFLHQMMIPVLASY
jgi:nucleotide-binding universal stress UspA family protein